MARQKKRSTRVRRAAKPRSDRLVPRFIGRIALVIGAFVIVGSLANSFLVLPVQSWFGQRAEIGDRQEELDALKEATDRLQTEVDRLNTPEGVQQAAREELGFVMTGEDRRVVVGNVDAPLDLPSGWPYDMVEQIVHAREIEAAQDSPGDETATEPATQYVPVSNP
jgi:cell division protein FtsB